jgi:hypothetical protein
MILFWLSIVASLASIAGFITALTSGGFTTDKLYIVAPSTIYILALIIIQLYILIDRSHGQVREEKAKYDRDKAQSFARALEKGYAAIHAIAHKYRDRLMDMLNNQEKLFSWDDEFLLTVLDNLRRTFEHITGKPCATCLKYHDHESSRIITVSRDSESAAERSHAEHLRRGLVIDNTASKRIIRGGDKHFFCNDLSALAECGEYYSDNYEWASFYKSAIVWPVRYYDPAMERMDIIGLLCVDSPETDVFDKQVCVQLGAAIADLLYPYMKYQNSKWTRDADAVTPCRSAPHIRRKARGRLAMRRGRSRARR